MQKGIGTHLLAMLLLVAMGCSEDPPISSTPPTGEDDLTVTVHWNDTRQTLDGFGASGAWSLQFVGENWPVEKRKHIADLLFSQAFDEDGHPKGIGLSVWRFYVGAGSAAQGDASGIQDPWRRAEGFLTDKMTYDWSKQAGQQWFLRAAEQRGVSTFIAFAISPPVELTKNGKAYSDGSGHANLTDDHYDDYARFLITVLEHFRTEGVPLDYVSPVNEPQWNWDRSSNQEGSPWQNEELQRLVEELSGQIVEAGLSTQILIPEAGTIAHLFASDTPQPNRDNQIVYFFGGERPPAVVAPVVAGHSYWTTWPVSKMIQLRKQLHRKMQAVDPALAYWMTEYCILGKKGGVIQGRGRDLGMDPALYVARVIHFDLTRANASSWQWWLAVSPYDYKDGLVYIDKDKHNGQVYDSKLLWAVGNYSRFLQPGAVRVTVARSDDATAAQMATGLMVSAYRSADAERVVVVAVNYSGDDRAMRLRIEGKEVQSWQPYVTSSTSDLAPGEPVAAGAEVTVPARSIVTFVGSL